MHTATDYFLVRLCFSTNGSLQRGSILSYEGDVRGSEQTSALNTHQDREPLNIHFSGMRKGNSTDRQIYISRHMLDTSSPISMEDKFTTDRVYPTAYLDQEKFWRNNTSAIEIYLYFLHIQCVHTLDAVHSCTGNNSTLNTGL